MANRYSVANGNWSSTSTWSSTLGGSPGASVPTNVDDVIITSSKSVTVDVDAEAFSITFSSGTFTVSGSNTLSVYNFFVAAGGNSKTLNLNAGTVTVNGQLSLSSNTTVNAGTSTIIIFAHDEQSFTTSSKEFNDVYIVFANDEGIEYSILGSPKFRMLCMQTFDGNANTVKFDNAASLVASKFIAIGASTSSRLRLGTGSTDFINTGISINSGGTTYGQFINIDGLSATGAVNVPHYIGANSIETYSAGSRPWLLQDPPKISTLVDPLTIAPGSNDNWIVTGTVTQTTTGVGGGGYSFDTSGSKEIITADTYDLLDSSIIIEYPEDVPLDGGFLSMQLINMHPILSFNGLLTPVNTTHVLNGNQQISAASPVLVKYVISSTGVVTVSTSTNGSDWTSPASLGAIPEGLIPIARSTRLRFYNSAAGVGLVVGSINMLPATSKGNFLPFFLP